MTDDIPEDDSEALYAQVPDDFPRTPNGYSLTGLAEKLALLQYGGKLYQPGTRPHEVYERWDICEDLARQFAARCKEVEHGKFAHLSHEEILDQYCKRLLRKDWGSTEEMKWVIRRTAALINWPIPSSAAPSNAVE